MGSGQHSPLLPESASAHPPIILRLKRPSRAQPTAIESTAAVAPEAMTVPERVEQADPPAEDDALYSSSWVDHENPAASDHNAQSESAIRSTLIRSIKDWLEPPPSNSTRNARPSLHDGQVFSTQEIDDLLKLPNGDNLTVGPEETEHRLGEIKKEPGYSGLPVLPIQEILEAEKAPPFHDSDQKGPWKPAGGVESALVDAHVAHKTIYEAQKAYEKQNSGLKRRHLETLATDLFEPSWTKKMMVDRLQNDYRKRMREWVKRTTAWDQHLREVEPSNSAPADADSAGSSRTATASPDPVFSAGEASSIAGTVGSSLTGKSEDDSATFEDQLPGPSLEPLRRIIRPQHMRRKPRAATFEVRSKVFEFAKGLWEHVEQRPMPMTLNPVRYPLVYKLRFKHTPDSNLQQADEEVDFVEEPDSLESMFEEPDRPIGMFDEAEVDYFVHRERKERIGELKEAGYADDEIEDFQTGIFGLSAQQLDERYELCRQRLISERKLLPDKPPASKKKASSARRKRSNDEQAPPPERRSKRTKLSTATAMEDLSGLK